MNLYILRHGLAVSHDAPGVQNDADRPLTAKGKQRLWRVTEAMEALDLSFDAVLTSPFPRALQTAQIVTEALELRKKLTLTDHLTPEGNPKALIEQLNKMTPPAKDVLLVGHEPYLSKLVALLTTGNTTATVELKKGGIARLQTQKLRYGRCATLVWLLTPRQLLLMA